MTRKNTRLSARQSDAPPAAVADVTVTSKP